MATETVPSEIPILLAESDPEVLSAFKGIFEEFQFQNVTIVKDAYEVLRMEEAAVFGLILLASSLTEMTPPKMVAALRAGGKNSQTPIIFLHKPEEEPLAKRAVAAGSSAVLAKPVKEEELRGVIEKLLGKRLLSKREENARSAKFIEAATRAVGAVKQFREEGKFEKGEKAFLEALHEVFAVLAQLHHSNGDRERADRILEEAERHFPGVKARFEGRVSTSTGGGKEAEGAEPASPAGETADPDLAIFLAEKNNEDAAALERVLKELQFSNVAVAKDAVSVLRADDSTRFGLVFLSSSLTDMSPLKVVAALRAGEQNAETPVVILHGPKETSLAEQAVAAGASAALARPVEEENLRAAIEKLLGKRVVSRREAKEHSAHYLEAVSGAADAVKNLRQEKVFEGLGVPLFEALRELCMSGAELYLTMGDKKQAEHILEEARKMFPTIRELFRRHSEGFVQRGNERLKEEAFQKASAEFKAALTLNSENLDAYIGLGECYVGFGNKEEATWAFGRAIASTAIPGSPQILNRLGIIACRHEYFDIAIGAYDRLLSIYQFDPKLFYNKSLVHVRQREFGKALPLLSRALTLDPEFAPAKVLHKKVRAWMSQMPEATPTPE